MAGGDQRAHAILPFKPHRDIDRDHHHRQDGGQDAVIQQFAGNLGAHHLGAAILVGRAQLFLDLAHHGLVGVVLVAPCSDLVRLDADHHAAVDGLVAFAAAEILQLGFREAQAVHFGAHLADIDGLGGLHFHQHTAGEIDAQVEAVPQDRDHRNHDQQAVNRKRPPAVFDEIHIGRFRNESQQGHGAHVSGKPGEPTGGGEARQAAEPAGRKPGFC